VGETKFEWDAGNRAKCQKHGVSIEEIEAVFAHQPRTSVDEAHSIDEERFIAVGGVARPIFVVFTARDASGQRIVRPISARYMHRKELDRYAQAPTASED
jgi:uncharacterized DUF497 family protein